MSKKKEIERLKDEKSTLKNEIEGLRMVNMDQRYRIEKLEIMLQEERKASKEKYTELLEKYITMMERAVRLNEQREAD